MIKKKIIFQSIKYNKNVSNEAKNFFDSKNKIIEKPKVSTQVESNDSIDKVEEHIKEQHDVVVEKKKRSKKNKK